MGLAGRPDDLGALQPQGRGYLVAAGIGVQDPLANEIRPKPKQALVTVLQRQAVGQQRHVDFVPTRQESEPFVVDCEGVA